MELERGPHAVTSGRMIRIRLFYLIAAILGAILPYVFFISHMASEEFRLASFGQAVFANSAASGIAVDLFISSAIFWVFLFSEARDRGMKHAWAFVLANLAVGLSFALPLFLFFREGRIVAQREAAGE